MLLTSQHTSGAGLRTARVATRAPTPCRRGIAHSHAQSMGRELLCPAPCSKTPIPSLLRATRRCRKHLVVSSSVAAPPAMQKPPEVQVQVEEVALYPVFRDVSIIRCTSRDRLKYEIEFGLKRGTTDNCYVIKGRGNSVVLLDVPVQAYAEQFARTLSASLEVGKLTHVILTHTAPNRLPALESLLRARMRTGAAAKLLVYLTNPSLKLVNESLGAKEDGVQLLEAAEWVAVKGADDRLTLGDGSQLSFVTTPTPRWPTLMCAYDEATSTMFSSKFFSAHVCPSLVGKKESAADLGGWQLYGADWKYFFDCMFAPVASQAAVAFDKLNMVVGPPGPTAAPAGVLFSLSKAMGGLFGGGSPPSKDSSSPPPPPRRLFVQRLAPLHGPVVKVAASELMRQYQNWVGAQLAAVKSARVAVLYASAYGNTAALAQALSQGVIKSDVAVETINLELVTTDEAVAAIKQSNGFMIGSPTLGGHMPTQVQATLGSILSLPSAKELPCGVFGSFGWSGEAVDEMQSRLRNAGFNQAFDPIKVKFRPTMKDLQVCSESGRRLAGAVKQQISNRGRVAAKSSKEVGGSAPLLAAGRLVGSLCVVTAKEEDAVSAMLASWVSQASFTPPGLTVAVKKDRAIESLLTNGSSLAMSLVPEKMEKEIMRKLARPFKVGEDRLAGLDTSISEASGCPVLTQSHAVLDCQVVSRMEAGDHVIIYCEVKNGKLQDAGQLTAVHHRKVANHY